jgi:beta-lactamase regulating signal transducer with metallopeptidase domain
MIIIHNIDPLLDASLSMILHSTWQFSLIAVICFIIQRYLVKSSSSRYLIGCISLALMFLAALITWIYFYDDTVGNKEIYFSSSVYSISRPEFNVTFPISWQNKLSNCFYENKGIILIAWLVGTGILFARILFSLFWVNVLVYSAKPIYNDNMHSILSKIKLFFNVQNMPDLGHSPLIQSPILVGFIKPIILIPSAIVNNLSISETEAILAHEMAHFIRKDIWINLLQYIMEMIFYYHPGVWWVSYQLRAERENCCDDLAIKYTGNNMAYAKALVNMQQYQINHNHNNLALYMANESNFSNRIKRILYMNSNHFKIQTKSTSLIFIIVAVIIGYSHLHGRNFTTKDETVSKSSEIAPVNFQNEKIDTLKEKQKFSVQRIENGKSLKMTMEDGNITNLEIDGKTISPENYDDYQKEIEQVKPKSLSNRDNTGFHMYFGDDNNWSFGDKDFKILHWDSIMNDHGVHMLKLKERIKDVQDKYLNKMDFDSIFSDRMMFFDYDTIINNFGKDFIFKFDNDGDYDGNIKIYRDFDENPKIFDYQNKENNYSDILGDALNKDGLLIPGKENSVELTGRYLKINSQKQPENIYNKYRTIFEEETGIILDKKSKLNFKILGKESKRKYRVY